MERINFDLSQQLSQNQLDIVNKNTSTQSENTNVNFRDLLLGVNNVESDDKTTNIIKYLVQKYNICITVTPNKTDKNEIHAG